MERPLADKRPIGPFIYSSPDPNEKLERYVRRLDRAGAIDPRITRFNESGYSVIDFRMIVSDPEKVFSSSIEFNEDLEMRFIEIRLPHVTVGESGISRETRREKMVNIWEEMQADISNIIADNTSATVEYGLVQHDGIEVRSQDGFITSSRGQDLSPHIQFTNIGGGLSDMTVPITFDELARIINDLNEMWKWEYSDLEIINREDLTYEP